VFGLGRQASLAPARCQATSVFIKDIVVACHRPPLRYVSVIRYQGPLLQSVSFRRGGDKTKSRFPKVEWGIKNRLEVIIRSG